jgi:hypothetical protein
MRNQTLIKAAKEILKGLLSECTPGQQLMFKRMYSHKDLDIDINLAIDQMDPDKIDHAISQAERSVEENKKNFYTILNSSNPNSRRKE